MNIVEKPLEKLKPYGKNPRKNDDAVKYVQESIETYGFRVPLVIDTNNVIIAGHTRYKAAKNLGMETVPCTVVEDLTPEQIKAFRLIDNKTAEKSYWDFDMLHEEMKSLDFEIPEWKSFGFDDLNFNFLKPDFGVEQEKESGKGYQMFHAKLPENNDISNIVPSDNEENEEPVEDKPSSQTWLERGLEYSSKQQEKKRIIIEYTDDDESFVLAILHCPSYKMLVTADDLRKWNEIDDL